MGWVHYLSCPNISVPKGDGLKRLTSLTSLTSLVCCLLTLFFVSKKAKDVCIFFV
ncbi:hypothetical protein [Escherichia phage UPEC06]|nr:hypothetical protein [Escherichia phage UPEC06]